MRLLPSLKDGGSNRVNKGREIHMTTKCGVYAAMDKIRMSQGRR